MLRWLHDFDDFSLQNAKKSQIKNLSLMAVRLEIMDRIPWCGLPMVYLEIASLD